MGWRQEARRGTAGAAEARGEGGLRRAGGRTPGVGVSEGGGCARALEAPQRARGPETRGWRGEARCGAGGAGAEPPRELSMVAEAARLGGCERGGRAGEASAPHGEVARGDSWGMGRPRPPKPRPWSTRSGGTLPGRRAMLRGGGRREERRSQRGGSETTGSLIGRGGLARERFAGLAARGAPGRSHA